MDSVSGIPFHLAKAYGIERTTPVRPITPKAQTPRTISPADRAPASDGLRLFHPQGGSKANPGVANLVGATVPGSVDFSSGDPQARTGSLALYHAPAARNAAATGVDLGRMLDTTA